MKRIIFTTNSKFFLFFVFLIFGHIIYAQKVFGDKEISWQSSKPPVIPATIETYSMADLVILDEAVRFHFYARNNEKIVKRVMLKIQNEDGLAALQRYVLPETFDYAYDACLYKQGRRARIKTPYILDSELRSLAARRYANGRWSFLELDYKYEPVKWISGTGEFKEEDITVFKFKGLQVDDIVEIQYELEFNANYGSNLFYFNSVYPKLNCEYEFLYKMTNYWASYAFVLPIYIPDSMMSRSVKPAEEKGSDIYVHKIKFTDLQAVNYPANSFEGKALPHVYVDFRFFRQITNVYSTPDGRTYDAKLTRSRNFEWFIIKDTNNYYTKIYDKQSASIRKFVATLPALDKDSTHKTFFKALCDTFNSFRYITSNHLFYNESHLYSLSSGDHLLKRRLVGSTWKLCRDILNDNQLFYYVANIQDRRYGEHSPYYRAHYGYEGEIIALPSGSSYSYFIPRYGGIKYHLNELPFYYEGVLASLKPTNFQDNMTNKDNQFFKFIKTHHGTANENTRTENATVKISLDSAKVFIQIKESLSGQFSTVLRHLYLRDYIDSTISPHYFKRCTEKPGLTDAKIKLSSKITDYPFRYTFNCAGNVKLQNKQNLDLSNWFSFLLSKQLLPEAPTHDYYMDFEFSDAYNFLLEFDKPVDIKNSGNFNKKLSNELFELESAIVKNSDTSYLLRLSLSVKNRKIALDKINALMELVSALDELNSFSLELAAK
jgi:hypothetical protein